MSKNKKNKKNKEEKEKCDIIYTIDNSMNSRFESMKLEIEFYQREIDKAEKKSRKKAYKKMKKNNTFYVPKGSINVRERVIREMEGNNFFERVSIILQELIPFARVIAELIKSLIVAILSIDSVKYRIKKDTLQKIDNIYNIANSVVSLA